MSVEAVKNEGVTGMGLTFTEEQNKVIYRSGRSLLVSAAAGSGKTAVLVERIIKKISRKENPCDIDRMLIVTFTKAAASEMRERIGIRLRQELEAHPENIHLEKQMTLLHNALITTIDGFCLYLIRNHFDEVQLDPSFRLADEGEIALLEQDVLETYLEEQYAAKEPAFIELMRRYALKANDSRPDEMIASLYRYAMSHPYPEEWLMEVARSGEPMSAEEMDRSPWFQVISRHIDHCVGECEALLEQMSILAGDTQTPEAYYALINQDSSQLQTLKGKSLMQTYQAWSSLDFSRMPSNRHPEDSENKERILNLRNREKKILKDIAEGFFSCTTPSAVEYVNRIGDYVTELAELTIGYIRKMKDVKNDKNLIDFPDLEHLALKILLHDGSPTPIALEYREHFDEIMIDEYQDSNSVQELLLRIISGEDCGRWNRFLVGDVKQSIYKFRLARPEIFMQKYADFPLLPETDTKGVCERIDLNRNFRSRRQVIETVNEVFSRIMCSTVGNVEYDDAAALKEGAVYPDVLPEYLKGYQSRAASLFSEEELRQASSPNQTEMIVVQDPDKSPDGEIRAIASRIRQMVGSFPVTDKKTGELRPALYSDIVILLRATAGWEEPFRRIMEEQGIPLHMISKSGYFSTNEVAQILNLLAVLDNPRQEIPLVGTLKSLFLNFTDEEIAIIRLNGRHKEHDTDHQGPVLNLTGSGNYYDMLVRFAESVNEGRGNDAEVTKIEGELRTDEFGEENSSGREAPSKKHSDYAELRMKCARAIEFLRYYREKVPYTAISDLINDILESTDYMNLISALPGGQQRRANVCLLIEKARIFAQTSYMGLFHFLRYIDRLKNRAVDFGEANMIAENADVVRAMTIHKSKGLEFPICFVSGLGRNFSNQETRGAMLADVDLGVALDDINPDTRIKTKTLKKRAMALKIKLDSRGEDLRVLYVAMTRAKEKLILTGRTDKEIDKLCSPDKVGFSGSSGTVRETVSYSTLLKASSYLDILAPLIHTHAGKSMCLFVISGEEQLRAAELTENVSRALVREEWGRQPVDSSLYEYWRERFERSYPYEKWKDLYNKTTVSEIKKAAYEEEEEAGRLEAFEQPKKEKYIPEFLRENEEHSGGAERGTAYHRLMELLSFSEMSQVDVADYTVEVCSRMEKYVQEGRMTAAQAGLIGCDRIVAFLSGSLLPRMAQAEKSGRLRQEQPFVLGVAASRLNPDFPESKTILVQGVIDAFFEEDDGIVVLDYKTDRVKEEETLRLRYQKQLDYYAEALEKLTGKKVKEKLIYSFSLGKTITL